MWVLLEIVRNLGQITECIQTIELSKVVHVSLLALIDLGRPLQPIASKNFEVLQLITFGAKSAMEHPNSHLSIQKSVLLPLPIWESIALSKVLVLGCTDISRAGHDLQLLVFVNHNQIWCNLIPSEISSQVHERCLHTLVIYRWSSLYMAADSSFSVF
jgi:hypothetical protein